MVPGHVRQLWLDAAGGDGPHHWHRSAKKYTHASTSHTTPAKLFYPQSFCSAFCILPGCSKVILDKNEGKFYPQIFNTHKKLCYCVCVVFFVFINFSFVLFFSWTKFITYPSFHIIILLSFVTDVFHSGHDWKFLKCCFFVLVFFFVNNYNPASCGYCFQISACAGNLVSPHLFLHKHFLCVCPGRSLTVDMWTWSLRGVAGRLYSFIQSSTPNESCLSFYYKLYGPNTGEEPWQVSPALLLRGEGV